MRKILLVGLSLIAMLVSCKNEDDQLSPGQAVLGVYQQVGSDQNDELEFVRTIELKQGQEVIFQGTVRAKGESETLGYQFYYEGTYTLEDQVVVMDFNETFSLTDPDITYVPKEELTEIERGFSLDDRYFISEDYQELSYICPPNALCAPPTPFEKIN